MTPRTEYSGNRRWQLAQAAALLSVSLATLSFPAGAATTSYYSYSKLPSDLTQAIDSGTTPSGSNWSSTVNGVPMVQVLIVGNGSDPDMVSLRAAVVANGGSVFMRYASVTALSALLPAAKVKTIAARADVTSISPNRPTVRTASLLESITGIITGTIANNASLTGTYSVTVTATDNASATTARTFTWTVTNPAPTAPPPTAPASPVSPTRSSST